MALVGLHSITSNCMSLVCCSKLLNSCVPDSLDERALNLPADASSELARREALQNNALCINAAKALGCSLADVTPEDIFEGKVRLKPCAALTRCAPRSIC